MFVCVEYSVQHDSNSADKNIGLTSQVFSLKKRGLSITAHIDKEVLGNAM